MTRACPPVLASSLLSGQPPSTQQPPSPPTHVDLSLSQPGVSSRKLAASPICQFPQQHSPALSPSQLPSLFAHEYWLHALEGLLCMEASMKGQGARLWQEGGETPPPPTAGSGSQYSGWAAKQGRNEVASLPGRNQQLPVYLVNWNTIRQLGVRGCLMFIHVPFTHCLSVSVTVPGALCGHSPFFNFLCLQVVPGQASCAFAHQLIYKL